MRLVTCFTAAAAYCLAVATSQAIPKTYFVELSQDAAAGGLALSPDTLADKAAELSVALQVRFEFRDKSIFYGASVALESDLDAEKLRSLPGVENVIPVQRFEHPERPLRPVLPSVGLNSAAAGSKSARSVFPRQSSQLDWNSPHAMTGVDRLHAKGILGEGIRVAVMDTGIDYNHPALGGCFGEGCKVEFGYDFVGPAYGDNGDSTPRPGPDPGIGSCYEGYHGTHVAGIIGMEVPSNASLFPGLVGVAPRATLGMYRVFGCSGFASEDAMVAGMQKAVEDRADVLSISIGYPGTWSGYPKSPLSAAVAALRAKGIAVVASAGNAAANGMFSLNLPGGSDGSFAVASVENTKILTYPARGSDGVEFRYANLYPLEEGEYPVAWAGRNSSSMYNYGCSATDYPPASSLSEPIGNYILAVKKSKSCNIMRIQELAAAANYTKVFTYPDPLTDDIFVTSHIQNPPVLTADGTVFPMGSTIGKTLSNAAQSTEPYKVIIESQTPMLEDQLGGGAPNNFSSIGPNSDFAFKPNIAGPGGSILATFPLVERSGGFGIIGGTSMAAPYVAGVYALIKSQHPSLSVDEICELMQTTAKQIGMADRQGISPVGQQGAGLVQAYDALFSKSVVQPGQFEMVDIEQGIFTIDNPSDGEVTYSLSNIPATGIAPFASGPRRTDQVNYIRESFSAKLTFAEGEQITIPAGSSQNVTFTVTLPTDVDAKNVPIYSGFIGITSSLNETFSIPYMGPAFNYTAADPVGRTPLTPEQKANALTPTRDRFSAPQVFANSDKTDLGNYRAFNFQYPDYPVAYISTLQPLRQLRFDVVRASTNFTPTWYGFDPEIVFDNLTETAMADNGTVGGLSILGAVEVQDGWLPRTNYQASWSYSILDVTGSRGLGLKKGSYRILIRWLKFFRDEEDPEAWESWMSGVVDVLEDTFEPTPPY
ncbi:subtilisin-like protease [Colletotrichum sojae]|uniref:Subtilisin-like protease n=1 Tax=Colletotrichum sojae TaxID=2175907 RepID=A0A8H6MSY7_9PEZI|nr:subtilisin-like protease [Colletotrichum sojae]